MRCINAEKRNIMSYVSLWLIRVTPVPYKHSSIVVQVLESLFSRYSIQTLGRLKKEIYRPITWSGGSGVGDIQAAK